MDRVTDLKKEWKGKVRVHVARTDSFRSSLLLPIHVFLGNIFSFSKEGMVVEQLNNSFLPFRPLLGPMVSILEHLCLPKTPLTK